MPHAEALSCGGGGLPWVPLETGIFWAGTRAAIHRTENSWGPGTEAGLASRTSRRGCRRPLQLPAQPPCVPGSL